MHFLSETDLLNKNDRDLPLIIGFFDCIHWGHKKLFQYVENKKFNILTFINVPSKLQPQICTYKQRMNNIRKFKPNKILIIDLEKYNWDSEKFENIFLKQIISPSEIVVGSDFRYGKNQSGETASLSKKFKTKVIPYQKKYQTKIIKELIQKNEWKKINKITYLPIQFEGTVVHGKMLGRTLGYPTANIFLGKSIVPIKNGIYYGLTTVDRKAIPSAIFVHTKNRDQLIESHILDDFNNDIYEKIIKIEFKKFISESKRISGTDNLKKHIDKMLQKIKKEIK